MGGIQTVVNSKVVYNVTNVSTSNGTVAPCIGCLSDHATSSIRTLGTGGLTV